PTCCLHGITTPPETPASKLIEFQALFKFMSLCPRASRAYFAFCLPLLRNFIVMISLSPTLQLATDLIRCRSVTPEDDGCQALMIQRLEAIGFRVERLRFGEVDNFWAVRGERGPLLVFAGHTDVVPTGPEANWDNPPFEPRIIDGMLHGRGAAD